MAAPRALRLGSDGRRCHIQRLVHAVLLFSVASIVQTCSQPAPIPTPVPTVDAPSADPFAGKVFNCHAVPLPDRQAAYEPVSTCLVSGFWPDCLTDLLTSFAPNTLTCLVRDLGASANAAVLAGTATNTDATTAKNARAWILQEGFGYK